MSMISIHLEQIDMNVILAPSPANVRQMHLHVKYHVFWLFFDTKCILIFNEITYCLSIFC